MQLNESIGKRLSPNGRKLKRENSSTSTGSSSQLNLRQLIRTESYNGGFVDLLFKEHALAMSLSHAFRFRPKPFTRPRLKEVVNLIQVALRFVINIYFLKKFIIKSFKFSFKMSRSFKSMSWKISRFIYWIFYTNKAKTRLRCTTRWPRYRNDRSYVNGRFRTLPTRTRHVRTRHSRCQHVYRVHT